jgi:hypothetical protein
MITRPSPLHVTLAAGLALTAFGCDATSGARVTLPVSLTTTGGRDVAAASGWRVTLTRAELHVDGLYFFEGEPLLVEAAPWWRTRLVEPLVGVAWAHPGHYASGEALAELPLARTLDLLAAGPTALGDAAGVTGAYRSVTLRISPDATRGATARVEGFATRSSTAGEARITFAESIVTTLDLEGIAFTADVDAAGAAVGMQVSLDRWVERMDLTGVRTSTGPSSLAGQPRNALVRGVEDLTAYTFTAG